MLCFTDVNKDLKINIYKKIKNIIKNNLLQVTFILLEHFNCLQNKKIVKGF